MTDWGWKIARGNYVYFDLTFLTNAETGWVYHLISTTQTHFILNIYFLFRFTIQMKHLYTFLYILTIEESLNWCRKSCKSFVLFALYHIMSVKSVWWELQAEVKLKCVLLVISSNIQFSFVCLFRSNSIQCSVKKETQLCSLKQEDIYSSTSKHSCMTALRGGKQSIVFSATNLCTNMHHNYEWKPTKCTSFTCRQKQVKPNYISIKINCNNRQCLNTIKTATHYRLNQELKFLYIEKQKLNERLYKNHLECASTWHNNWQLIQSSIDNKLQRQIETQYDNLNKKTGPSPN